jgi:hypothetical protein
MARRLSLTLLSEPLAICRLGAGEPLPMWATAAPWWSITHTPDELSVVCEESCVPVGVNASRGWRALRFAGPLPLDQTGILESVTAPLAAARISVFAVGTYDTDYVLIPSAQRSAAIAALERAGHSVASAF